MKNKLNILSIVLCSLLPFYSHAQVVIGQNTENPDASAELQIETKSTPADVGGLILPQLEDKSYNIFSESWGKEIRKGLLLQNGGTTNILKFKGATGQVNSDALWDIVDPWITTKINAKDYKLDFAINSPSSLMVGGNFTSIDLKGAFLTGAKRIDNATLGVTPIGGIIMWSGAIGDIPDGWILCDGKTYSKINNAGNVQSGFTAPDLTGRFIVGYGEDNGDNLKKKHYDSKYAKMNEVGGEKEVLLEEAQIPEHDHNVGVTVNVTETDLSNKNLYVGQNGTGYPDGAGDNTGEGGGHAYVRHTYNLNRGRHKHSTTVSVTEDKYGKGQAHENRPPFYVLAFIMYTGVVQ
ncbi:tail fiber protein [Flammeovirga aprica]|uniref:Phage tail collar domain-containing protein n=1 Tax=Flammeovirga aprica JL-4 TaxID=694437 RepID=A0A7X9RY38_9BACT|nr:tail fiber protein [Flammeovirga aprica]NME70875.1 hypothetical protein [Flammeovirga aprica JL-4]